MSPALALAAMIGAVTGELPVEPQAGLFGLPLAPAEMAEVRGTYIPVVGVELSDEAAAAAGYPSPAPLVVSNLIQEVTDNWNLAVATPLIAAARDAAG